MADPIKASDLRQLAALAADDLGLPEEIEISYPVPVRSTRLTAAVFAAFAVPTPDGLNFALYAPVARIDLDWNDGSVVSTTMRDDVIPVDDDHPIGLTRPTEFQGPPFGDEEERCREVEAELLASIDRAARAYGLGLDDIAEQAVCLGLFRRLVPEPIRALYEQLSPDFFGWLEGHAESPPGWTPTHDVPADGMQVWSTPDPSTPVVGGLEPGVPVQVLATSGDWAQVIASKGQGGWVDGRRLAPHR